MKSLLLLFLILTAATYQSIAQCNITVSWTQSITGNNISFTNTSTGAPTFASYYWTYGTQTSSLQNPTFNSLPTNENACLTIIADSTCSETLCQLIPGDSTSTSCNINVSWTQNVIGNDISFTNTSTGAPALATYSWTYGAQTSTLQNPTFTVISSSQNACLTITGDTTCTETLCQLISSDSSSTGCNISVSWTQNNTGNNISFTNTSTGAPALATYSWTYGAQTSTLQNPTFTVISSSQNACLTITGDTSCTETLCQLISGDSTSGCNIAVSWTQNNTGNNISFTNTSTGVPAFATYTWTYGTQTSSLENPTFMVLSSSQNACLTITGDTSCTETLCQLISGDSTSGCNIAVSWTQNNTGNNITFTNTSTGIPALATYTWTYGAQTSSLQNPTFTALNSNQNACLTITGDTSCTETLCQLIAIDSTASISNYGENSNLNIYPNPANQFINFSTHSNITSGQVKIYALSGQLVLEMNFNSSTNSIQTIDIQSLKQGMYFINITDNQNTKITQTKKFSKTL